MEDAGAFAELFTFIPTADDILNGWVKSRLRKTYENGVSMTEPRSSSPQQLHTDKESDRY